ncbi:3-deoxy-D-manno-octulosonic acid kinase [Kaarinaea lacus]
MKPAQLQQNQHYFIFDQDALEQVNIHYFDPAFHEQGNSLRGQARGRGMSYFITLEDQLDCVLRHYRRGGMIARFTDDKYLWSDLEQTRPWREWQLLKLMTEKQLPVPSPVAAHVYHQGLYYTADIITRQILAAQSLSMVLGTTDMDDELWRQLGKTIRRFHQQGIYHADLNAHNILIDDSERFYLIDFDKGQLRKPSSAWQQSNLDRLQRSLQKLKEQNPNTFSFSLHHWGALLQAYSSGS